MSDMLSCHDDQLSRGTASLSPFIYSRQSTAAWL